MAEFFYMGGHGFYIWSSYAIVTVVLVYHYYLPIRKRKNMYQSLSEMYKGMVN